jgi:N6-L-threonylcarbamoyladenine synthase
MPAFETILAIESSCDETAAAVVRGQTILSNVVSSQIDVHRATGGVVPEVAARLQLETIQPVIAEALSTARVDWDGIEAIAVTTGPGLIGSLMVGIETAKALAFVHDKPLIPVNHLAGHLYACLSEMKQFRFPYLGLIVSGGHTELVLMTGHHQFTLLGETRDDAAGEAFDKVAQLLDLRYPGGPEISKLAEQGDPTAFSFPRAMLDQDNLDFSFSGLKSAVRRVVIEAAPDQAVKANIAAAFQAAVIDALVQKTVRAAVRMKPTAVLLGGGVAANMQLRTDLAKALTEQHLELLVTPPELATDNAAMIGLAATYSAQPLSGPVVRQLVADPGAALAAD